MTVYQVTDDARLKNNIYCERSYCSPDSRSFIYQRRTEADPSSGRRALWAGTRRPGRYVDADRRSPLSTRLPRVRNEAEGVTRPPAVHSVRPISGQLAWTA